MAKLLIVALLAVLFAVVQVGLGMVEKVSGAIAHVAEVVR